MIRPVSSGAKGWDGRTRINWVIEQLYNVTIIEK